MSITIEEIITELVVNGGNARSKSMEAIREAKKGEFKLAEEKIKEANEALNKAHEFQTNIIQAEAAGEEEIKVTLLMVHGQDHLMNAMTVRDLAIEMIEMYKEIKLKDEK